MWGYLIQKAREIAHEEFKRKKNINEKEWKELLGRCLQKENKEK